METFYLVRLALMFHIIGLTIAAGLSLAHFLAAGKFWKAYCNGNRVAGIFLGYLSRIPILISIGIGLSIISGVTMMHLAYGAVMGQLWFQIKMGILIALIANAIAGIWLTRKLRRCIRSSNEETATPDALFTLIRNVRLSATVQLLLFLVVIILAAFRFQ